MLTKKFRSFVFVSLSLFFTLKPAYAVLNERMIILVTTTSVQDSGFLDPLLPSFERRYGYFVKAIAVGSGQALALGRRGEADVLLVHSPEEEKEFMASGYGTRRITFMYNRFLVVGPKADPCCIRSTKNAKEALKKIAQKKCLFLSRGDNSGTHIVEKRLWKEIGIDPTKEKWYQETGHGMGITLNMAMEKDAYTISDSATYLALEKSFKVEPSFLKDRELLNIYSVIEVSPLRFKKVNEKGAKAFSSFLLSPEVQNFIRRFGKEKYGSPLFVPYGDRERKIGKWK